MVQFTWFASLHLCIQCRIQYRYCGFPHSDIYGSKLVCQLPVAFRRLPRPSSPVIAKASIICTYSLDPITLKATGLWVLAIVPFIKFAWIRFLEFKKELCLNKIVDLQSQPVYSYSQQLSWCIHEYTSLCFFQIVKEHNQRWALSAQRVTLS